jgi:phage virion morphogenesis protein
MTIRMDGAEAIDGWLKSALAALDAGERRRLFREIGRELQRRTRKRMAAESGPDGAAWAPRARDRHGKIRKAATMMTGLRAARRLTVAASAAGAKIGWSGRDARIAAVHQTGALDFVDRKVSDAKIRYPARPLIGLAEDDIAFVREALLAKLGNKTN